MRLRTRQCRPGSLQRNPATGSLMMEQPGSEGREGGTQGCEVESKREIFEVGSDHRHCYVQILISVKSFGLFPALWIFVLPERPPPPFC